jgi:pimeloyl-ACP methyl ester carboxylesterase
MSSGQSFQVRSSDSTLLRGSRVGEGRPVLLLHGLTSVSRYVLMGSRLLERNGFEVAGYDARGHGQSARASAPDRYGYEDLTADACSVLDALGWQSALLIGVSMGAHTAAALALKSPERVSGLVLITPAFHGADSIDQSVDAYWSGLEDALRNGGIDEFVDRSGLERLDQRFRDVARTAVAQRMSLHGDLEAVADALHVVARSRPFNSLEDLAAITAPTTVVGSLDGADPTHPLAVAEEWASRIPDADLEVESEGESPLAWRGGTLSRLIIERFSA